MRSPMTIEEIQRSVEMYESGLTYGTVSEIIGRDPSTIRRNLNKAGVVMRQYRDYYAAKVNDSYFEFIDSEEKAYWLGFLVADACIAKSAGDFRAFHFVLQRRDHYILEQFKKAIEYSGDVHDFLQFVKHRSKSYKKSGIWFNNKIFCSHLSSKGWFDFKQNDDPLRMFSSVSSDLMSHFVRGFFDGDGCISNSAKSKGFYFLFSGSENVLSAVGDIIVREMGFRRKEPKKSKKCKCWRIGWNGNLQVVKFGEWLYKDATICLERKKVRFQRLFDRYSGLPQLEFENMSNVFYYPLSYLEISKLSQDRRNALVKQFEREISKRPWIDLSYDEDELKKDLARIDSEDLSDYRYLDGFRSRKISSLEFAGRKLLTHFQPHFWTTKYKNHPTLVDGWSNLKIRHKAVSNMFNTRGSRPSLARYLRELNFSGAARASHFHPGLVKSAIEFFAPDAESYLDPCAGWGARLLAANSMGLKYVACDPSHKTIEGLRSMSGFIGFDGELLCIPFEQYMPDRQFDLAFTSPPYFNLERYGYGEQSYKGKRTYEDWFYGFLIPLVEKCLGCATKTVLHVSSKMKELLLKSYNSSEVVPIYMQRSAGGAKSSEWFIDIRK